MSPEPTPEELRTRLEQSFERWRRRLDDPPPTEERRDDEPDDAAADE